MKIGGGHGSISYASNASTKDFVVPEGEVARFNQIMNEPIENTLEAFLLKAKIYYQNLTTLYITLDGTYENCENEKLQFY